jgi:hypothetical protein
MDGEGYACKVWAFSVSFLIKHVGLFFIHSHDHALKNQKAVSDWVSILFYPQILKKNKLSFCADAADGTDALIITFINFKKAE